MKRRGGLAALIRRAGQCGAKNGVIRVVPKLSGTGLCVVSMSYISDVLLVVKCVMQTISHM